MEAGIFETRDGGILKNTILKNTILPETDEIHSQLLFLEKYLLSPFIPNRVFVTVFIVK